MARNVVVRLTMDRFPEIARKLPREALQVIQETLEDIDARVKAGMQSSGGGRVYTRGGRTHQASAPGQMPAVDTAALIGSLKHEIARGKYTGYYYTTMNYAPMLEYGTSRMLSRPFLTPAAERARAAFIKKLRNLEGRLR